MLCPAGPFLSSWGSHGLQGPVLLGVVGAVGGSAHSYLGAGYGPTQPHFPPKGPGASGCLSGDRKWDLLTLSSFWSSSLSVYLSVPLSSSSLSSFFHLTSSNLLLPFTPPFLTLSSRPFQSVEYNSLPMFILHLSTCSGPRASGDLEQWSVVVDVPQPW